MDTQNTSASACASTVSARDHIAELLDEADRRYQQRYEAQTEAVALAFRTQETAMHAALASAEKAVAVALGAADRAVAKAENAAEKRFDSVNEFRQQLADQAATFMPRSEAESRLNALILDYQQRFEAAATARDFALAVSEKAVAKAEIAAEKRFETILESHRELQEQLRAGITRVEVNGVVARITDLSSRIDKTEGTAQGKTLSLGYLIAAMSLLLIVVNISAILLTKK